MKKAMLITVILALTLGLSAQYVTTYKTVYEQNLLDDGTLSRMKLVDMKIRVHQTGSIYNIKFDQTDGPFEITVKYERIQYADGVTWYVYNAKPDPFWKDAVLISTNQKLSEMAKYSKEG